MATGRGVGGALSPAMATVLRPCGVGHRREAEKRKEKTKARSVSRRAARQHMPPQPSITTGRRTSGWGRGLARREAAARRQREAEARLRWQRRRGLGCGGGAARGATAGKIDERRGGATGERVLLSFPTANRCVRNRWQRCQLPYNPGGLKLYF